MGQRVVVILDMDQSTELSASKDLGHQIIQAANASTRERREKLFPLGVIAQVTHADNDSLLLLQSLESDELANCPWSADMTKEETTFALLSAAAAKLGYTLTADPAYELRRLTGDTLAADSN